MEELLVLIKNGRYRAALQLAQQFNDPEVSLHGVLAAICLGEYSMACTMLEGLTPFSDPALEAERLALLAHVHYNQGRSSEYLRLAQQAVQTDQNYLAMSQLAMLLPPEQAVFYFREALAYATTPQEEGKAAYGLALVLERLGRFREAIIYASLAQLRDPADAVVVVAYVGMALAGSDEVVWDDLMDLLKPHLDNPHFGVQLAVRHLLSEIALLKGNLEEALQQSDHILLMVDRNLMPLVVCQAVRISLQAGQCERAVQLARAAQASDPTDPKLKGLARLALGYALYPAAASEAYFREAVTYLEGVATAPAVVARAHLASLRQQPIEASDRELIGQWSQAMRATLPRDVQLHNQPYNLRVLGQAVFYGPDGKISLRPRSLELLVLLLSKPEGWRREDLSLALYGRLNLNAVNVELTRLKSVLGDRLLSRPWRLDGSVAVDFEEFYRFLYRKEFALALRIYLGPLLPNSEAPGIEELRRDMEEDLRAAVISGRNSEVLMLLAERLPQDLEVWEALLAAMPQSDLRYYVVLNRVRRLKQNYQFTVTESIS
jgi:tetratricopeptide (TPR) repeat protein